MARKLGKRTDQRMAMLKNQVSELLWYGEIETTLDRAKEVRRLAEKYITLAIRSYQDEVKVTKTKTNAKGEKVQVEFVNDGAKKLAARRRLMAELRDLQEIRMEKRANPHLWLVSRTSIILSSRRCSKSMLPNTMRARLNSARAAATPAF